MMNSNMFKVAFSMVVATVLLPSPARAQFLDQLGVTALRATTTNLNGAGIRVAQPEASFPGTAYEVNPGNVGQPVSLFTYASDLGTATTYPNSVGANSGHADGVGQIFYSTLAGLGIATNVAHVDNFDADYFVNNYVVNLVAVNDAIVNQSYIFNEADGSHVSVGDQQDLDSAFDDYTAQFGTLFVSGAGNGGIVNPAATCYNGIGVAAYGGASSIGPTIDNGRSKPDITAPSSATSYSTPEVSGCAALLMQAGARGDGGGDTNSAIDLRTIKALLLNGAVKPLGWTNGPTTPLDARHGAGVVNILNSYKQLAGGKQGNSISSPIAVGGAHLPVPSANTVSVLAGWDFFTNTSSGSLDEVKHYYFNVSNAWPSTKFAATATLVWNRHFNTNAINNLNLFLYNYSNNNLVASSTSLVDNVEHIYQPNLAPGRYDLQVWKAGGSGMVSASEAYALAFEFVPTPTLTISGSINPVLTWPLYPAGFMVEARTNLLSGAWSTTNLSGSFITNGMNTLQLSTTNATQFFRLRSPNI